MQLLFDYSGQARPRINIILNSLSFKNIFFYFSSSFSSLEILRNSPYSPAARKNQIWVSTEQSCPSLSRSEPLRVYHAKCQVSAV